MAKGAKINYNFDDYSEEEFYKAVMLIYKVLVINIGVFTGTTMDLKAFKLAIDSFNETRTAPFYIGIGGDISAARTAIQTIVTTNGTWFNTFCNGVITLLNKTGYPMAKDAEAQGKLDATVLTVNVAKPAGSISFLISHIVGTRVKYGIMYTPITNLEPNPAKWTGFFYAAGQRDGVITDMPSKIDYKYSSFAMGTDRDITYSEPVILAAQ